MCTFVSKVFVHQFSLPLQAFRVEPTAVMGGLIRD